jgi:hypothetical protein
MEAVKHVAEPMSSSDLDALKAQSEEVREAIRAQFQTIIDSEG